MGLEFNKCCFCIGLRTGCLIIGYLLILALAVPDVVIANASKKIQDAKVDVDVETLKAVIFAVTVTKLVSAILFLTFNIVLIVGLHKNKRGHVKAYLIYVRIIIILSIIELFGMFGKFVPAENIVYQLVNIIFIIYFILVIKSYHLKMDDSANKPVIYNTV